MLNIQISYYIFINQQFCLILEQVLYLNWTQPPISTNDLYSLHVNKINSISTIESEDEEMIIQVGEMQMLWKAYFYTNETWNHTSSRFRGFPGNKESQLTKHWLENLLFLGRIGEIAPTQNLQRDLSEERATRKHLEF